MIGVKKMGSKGMFYWKNTQNLKEFVKKLEMKLDIKTYEDWYRISKEGEKIELKNDLF